MDTAKFLTGLLLLAVGAEPLLLHSPEPGIQTAAGPDSCQTSLSGPVPDGDSHPVVGTVSQSPENNSIVRVDYTVMNETLSPLIIQTPTGASLVSIDGDNISSGTVSPSLNRGDEFTVRYAVSEMEEHPNATYPAGEDWIIAPTLVHSGADVALRPAGSGFIASDMLYLGNYATHSREVGCQTITLIRPEQAEIDPGPRLDVLEDSARMLSIGRAYSNVSVFVSPGSLGRLGGFVPEYGNNIVIEANRSLYSPENALVHEYIHTRQIQYTGENFIWFQEASATYYAARLSLEQGLITPREYDAFLTDYASHSPEVRLATAEQDLVAYRWGAVVLARIDAALAAHGQSLMTVFADINEYGGPSYTQFEGELARHGLNESQLNATSAIVLDDKQPRPDPAYESRFPWLPPHSFHVILSMVGIGLAAREAKDWIDEQKEDRL